MYACVVSRHDDRKTDAAPDTAAGPETQSQASGVIGPLPGDAALDQAEPQLMDEAPRSRVGLRLFAAAVTIPWLLGYGVTGVWAVTRGAISAAGDLSSIDVGYSRAVSPSSVIFVGALLLAGFAVVLAAAMLILYDAHGSGRWAAVCVVATALTAGSVWASVQGELHPALWLVFFGGLLYAALLSLVLLVRALRAPGRNSTADP